MERKRQVHQEQRNTRIVFARFRFAFHAVTPDSVFVQSDLHPTRRAPRDHCGDHDIGGDVADSPENIRDHFDGDQRQHDIGNTRRDPRMPTFSDSANTPITATLSTHCTTTSMVSDTA